LVLSTTPANSQSSHSFPAPLPIFPLFSVSRRGETEFPAPSSKASLLARLFPVEPSFGFLTSSARRDPRGTVLAFAYSASGLFAQALKTDKNKPPSPVPLPFPPQNSFLFGGFQRNCPLHINSLAFPKLFQSRFYSDFRSLEVGDDLGPPAVAKDRQAVGVVQLRNKSPPEFLPQSRAVLYGVFPLLFLRVPKDFLFFYLPTHSSRQWPLNWSASSALFSWLPFLSAAILPF